MTDFAAEACRIAAAVLAREVTGARRFTTGLQHFVYEVSLSDGTAVVMRMTQPEHRSLARNALRLSSTLRPLGVPLPEVIAADVDAAHPWMMLERLAGTDLGAVVSELGDAQLRSIAAGVAAAQHAVARTETRGRYGYAPSAETAPFASWAEVVAAHIERSRLRIAAAGLFDLSLVEALQVQLDARRAELDDVVATPFLHDTTTKNVIVADGRLSGIVDVDDLCFGDPRYVAALTRVALTSHGVSPAYSEYLMEAAGWPEDGLFRLYVAAFLLDFMSEHGQRFNGNESPSSAEARDGLRTRFDTVMRSL